MSHEVFISVDIEASGPIPGAYSMLAIGACVVGNDSERFYAELRPINDGSRAEAMAVVGKSLEDFQMSGRDPAEGISAFGEWVRRVSGDGTPVFVGFNATFDWSFVNWYFETFFCENPFGIGGLDIKSFYMGLSGCAWESTRSSRLPVEYRGVKPLTHNALDDAVEQSGIFERMARDAGVLE